MRPIGSYFGWTRGSGSRTSSTSSDTPSRRASQQLSWATSPTNGRQSPFQSLDGMQECFWIEDNLRHTGRQLDNCSEKLNQMSDSAIYIRQELEDLEKILASMRTRGGGGGTRRDTQDTAPKDLDEKSPQNSPLSAPEKIKSPSVQPIQFQDIFPQTASYTTASIQTDDEREVFTGEKASLTQHAPEYLNMFPEILDSIEEEDLPQKDAGEEEEEEEEEQQLTASSLPAEEADSKEEELTTSSLPAEEADLKEDKEEDDSRRTPRSEESTASQGDNIPQDFVGTSLKEEDQPPTPRLTQSSPPEQNHPSPIAAGSTMDDEEHQRIPRSLRPNPVQQRFPFAAGGHSAAGASRATRTMTSNRASLKPVIGQKKVSQMTQFWSQKEATLDG